MTILDSHIVPDSAAGQRLYDYACIAFAEIIPSRKGIKKAIQRKAILVDGEIGLSGWRLRAQQKLELLDNYVLSPKIYNLPIQVLFENEHFAIVNKPHGLLTSGNQFRTLYNALGLNISKSKVKDALPYPSPCHRLDQQTAGCVLIAKSKSAQIHANKLFAQRKISKSYTAIVHGKIPLNGQINMPIRGQIAQTRFDRMEFRKSKNGEIFSKVKMYPLTGRTHQLRIHFACLGHPLLGDKLYGTKGNILLHKGLFLCATKLMFSFDNYEITGATKVSNKFSRFFKLIKI